MDVKHALITGGSRGLGEALGISLAKRGINVTLVDVRDCDAAAARIKEAGAGKVAVQCFQADVQHVKQLEQVVEKAEAGLGPIDLAVANAGVPNRPGHICEIAPEEFAHVLGVNTLGVIYTVKAVLPGMMQRKKGRILVVSSASAAVPMPGGSPYSISKVAVKGFADCLRLETLGTGVTVHLAMPVFVDTQMVSDIFNDEYSIPGHLDKYQKMTGPLLQPEEVVEAWVRGMEREQYMIWLPRFLPNFGNHIASSIISPTPLWWPIDVLISPFIALGRHIVRFVIENYILLPPERRLRRKSAGTKGKLEE